MEGQLGIAVKVHNLLLSFRLSIHSFGVGERAKIILFTLLMPDKAQPPTSFSLRFTRESGRKWQKYLSGGLAD